MPDSQKPKEELIAEINDLRQRLAALETEYGRCLDSRRKYAYEANHQFHDLLNAIPDFICIKDERGRIITVNNCFYDIFLSSDYAISAISKTDAELAVLAPHNRGAFLHCIITDEMAWQAGKASSFEEHVCQPDGSIRTFDVIKVPVFNTDGSRKGMVIVGHDITRRKEAEMALAENEERLRLVLQNMPVMMDAFDESGRIVMWNKECERVTGYTAEEIVGNPDALALLYPDPGYLSYILETAKQCNNHFRNWNIDITCKDGSVRTISWSNISHFFPINGWATWAFGIDVTDDIRSRHRLRQSKREFETLAENAPDIIARFDRNLRCTYINPAFTAITGLDRSQILGKPQSLSSLPAEVVDLCTRHLKTVFQTGEKVTFQIDYKRQDGRAFTLNSILVPELDGAGKVFSVLCLVRDITDVIRMENELARLDRLNLVGEIAASIGHEVRNPMTTVRGFLQMLQTKPDCQNYHEYFQLMIEEIDRANSIITEFLSLAKDKAVSKKPANLNSIITSFMPLLEADGLLTGKTIRTCLADSLPDLMLDKKEIRQLIANLAINGLEAMPLGGNLTIKTYMEDDCVVLSVSDQGPGIAPHILDKLGTPFVTTKDTGTGLGLAVCYSIANRHKASITVDTGPQGTTFFVKFPIPELRDKE